jgi:CheY-like chemotaxis protein
MLSQLESLQYRVDTAMNGREALSKYRAGSYDLVLTDLDMPEMNGYELAAAIRRAEQSGDRPVPILAITSTDFGLTQERAHALGFNGYMLKPFETELLGKKLESLSCPDQP